MLRNKLGAVPILKLTDPVRVVWKGVAYVLDHKPYNKQSLFQLRLVPHFFPQNRNSEVTKTFIEIPVILRSLDDVDQQIHFVGLKSYALLTT